MRDARFNLEIPRKALQCERAASTKLGLEVF